ncbi:YfhO family protein [Mucilaginibacter koreensis]
MNNWFKRNSVHLLIVGIFAVISFFYFTPVFQGKTLSQGDVIRAQSTQKEIMDVKAKTGKAPLWTNSMFSGMPAYQIWVPFPSNVTTYVVQALKTIFPNPVDTVLLYMLGAYLLLCVLGLNPWLAAAGGLAFAFSSYNFILIDAGHANQAYAIAFFAPVIAGIILTFRGRYLTGAVLTAFFLAMEIRCNHIQMTYYLMLAILIFVCIELYHAFKGKALPVFFKSVGYLAAATVLALSVNAALLWTTYEYGNESIRGKSNLTKHTTEPASGVDKDYAFQWSQGIGECFTFLVPNAYGGGSGTPVAEDSKAVKSLTDKGIDPAQAQGFVAQYFPSYWGDKPFTEGPNYFGAAICFLFVFGLLIVKSRYKWWLLGATLMSILLSFGRNFPLLSDFFFNYFPLYNKFRAVESILAVAGLCVPILAVLAVNEAVIAHDKKVVFDKLKIAAYITGGITLLLIVIPTLFLSFKIKDADNYIVGVAQQFFQGDTGLASTINSARVQDRIALERGDAIRSLIFIALAFGIVWALIKQKIKVVVGAALLMVITIIDLGGVDKRYLNDENFVAKEDAQQTVPQREVDQFIMRDSDPDFRVLDLSQGDPFTNASTSYYHKSIGGYHAAKLKRYQELIENQFTKSTNQDVLDMLNTKYIITADPKTQQAGMRQNQTACGHAWFVKSVQFAKNADEEMQAISAFNPKEEAIVDQQYKNTVGKEVTAFNPTATIQLTSYSPDHLVYQTGATSNQIAIFSEIYYDKGWKMYIDGVEKPYFRADYVLRGAVIPVGNHKVEFIFHPASYYTGEGISLAGSAILVLLLIAVAYTENKKKQAVVVKN